MFGGDDLPAVDPIATADAFFAASGAQIINSGRNPCYIPALDQIHMPKLAAFETAAGYYATLAHELVHWTGHKSRLDRFTDTAKTSYAFEELVAELGACFLLPGMGIAPDTANSAAYVQSWLRALRNDKKFIFQAASAAQKAVDFLGQCAAQESTQPVAIAA
jgi:antirestriction protein ArdC